MLPKALELLQRALEIERLFDSDSAALRIAASTTIGTYVLPPIIASHRRDQPESIIELKVANTRDVVDAVARFEADAGLIEGVCHHPDLTVSPWLVDELVIFAAPSHPLVGKRVCPAPLAKAEWVLREPAPALAS